MRIGAQCDRECLAAGPASNATVLGREPLLQSYAQAAWLSAQRRGDFPKKSSTAAGRRSASPPVVCLAGPFSRRQAIPEPHGEVARS